MRDSQLLILLCVFLLLLFVCSQLLDSAPAGVCIYCVVVGLQTTFSFSSCSRPDFSFIVLIVLIAWTNGLTNGILPSLQSYSCLPYGNQAYNLAVKLSVAVNPLACLLALFFQVKSLALLGLLGSLGTILSGYHIALAALSPLPPLVDLKSGAILAVSVFNLQNLSLPCFISIRGVARTVWRGWI